MFDSKGLTRVERLTAIDQRSAELPDNYKKMVHLIDIVLSVDECAEWSNKAAAAASYYKQSHDMSQEHKFQRIRLRARLRCREILDTLSEPTKLATIERVGIRPREYRQLGDALLVDRGERERLIEAQPPATLAALAKIGHPPPIYVPQPGTGSAPGFAAVLTFWKACKLTKPGDEARKIDPSDAVYLRQLLVDIEEWTGEFERNLPKAKRLTRE